MLRKICRKECHQIYQCCQVQWHEPGAWIFNGFWHGDLPSSWIENVITCVVAFAVFLKKLGLLFRLQYPGLFRMVCTPPGHNRFWLKRAGGEAKLTCLYMRVFFWRFRRVFVRAFATVHRVPASRSLSPTMGGAHRMWSGWRAGGRFPRKRHPIPNIVARHIVTKKTRDSPTQGLECRV